MIVDKRIYISRLPHRAKPVYCYLCDRADPQGHCWPSTVTMALDLAISRRTVFRALKDLEDEGFIRRQKQYGKDGEQLTNLYSLKGVRKNV